MVRSQVVSLELDMLPQFDAHESIRRCGEVARDESEVTCPVRFPHTHTSLHAQPHAA